MGRIEEVEEDEFNEIVAEKRHKELAQKLGDVATALSMQSDQAVVAAINGQGDRVASLVKAIENIQQPIVNNEKIVSLMNQISTDILESNSKVIQALEGRLLPDTFELQRSYGGIVQLVKVKYKSSKEIKDHNNGR
jgi:CMP-2-keto-3-deoxyoctulosonic acid synthetase